MQLTKTILKRILLSGFLLGTVLMFTPSGVQADRQTVKLAYVEWSEAIATTHMARAVLQEKLGYHCEMIPMKADKMWQAVADGEVDGMLAAWMPDLHAHYNEKYKDRVDNLGPNLVGTRTGLVVPKVTLGRQTAATGMRNKPYITAESIPDLKRHADKFHFTIEGIDAEAGVMKKTERALQEYGLYNYNLVTGSEKIMTKALADAIKNQQWIVVTGWIPHWMFARWELAFLDDPKNVFGNKTGRIDTIVRQGLDREMPQVYAFLDNFQWSPEELGQLMIWIHDDKGTYPYEKVLRFMRTHPEQVENWLSGVE